MNHNIDSYLKIYSIISKKQTSSKYMSMLYLQLTILKETIIESQLEDLLIDLIKDMELTEKFGEFRNENLDIHLQKIISICENCLILIENFIEPKGFKNRILNYFINDAFGSIYEMKFRLIEEFNCTEQFILSPDKFKLETLLISTHDNKRPLRITRENKSFIYKEDNELIKNSSINENEDNSNKKFCEIKNFENQELINVNKNTMTTFSNKITNLNQSKNIENFQNEILETEEHCDITQNKDFSSNSKFDLERNYKNIEFSYNSKHGDYDLNNKGNIIKNKNFENNNIKKKFSYNNKDKNGFEIKKNYLNLKHAKNQKINNESEAVLDYHKIKIDEECYQSNNSLIEEKKSDDKYSKSERNTPQIDKNCKIERSSELNRNYNNVLYPDYETDNNLKSDSNNNKKNLIIICCPNGGAFEYSINFAFINLYIKLNFDVFLWNYRGYGLSEGACNYDNIRKDSEAIYNHVRKLNKWHKIGVHGISIGGIPSCYLAGKNLVDFCIADRTFSSMENILKNFKFGTLLAFLYKLFWFYKSDNTENFLKANIPKLTLCDPNDSLVVEFSSLKSSVSTSYIKTKLSNERNSVLKFCLEENQNYENFVDVLLMCFMNSFTHEKHFAIRNSIKKISQKHENLLKIEKKSTNENTNKNYFAIELDSKIPRYEKPQDMNININRRKSEKFIIINSISDSSIENFSNYTLSEISNCIFSLNSAGEYLDNCQKHTKSIKNFKQFMENFFNNLFVWGSYPERLLELMDRKNHIDLAKESLDTVICKLNNLYYYLKKKNEKDSIESTCDIENKYPNLNAYSEKIVFDLRNDFTKIKNKFEIFNNSATSGFDNKLENMNKNQTDLELKNNLYPNINKNEVNLGNLIPLQCGHNGFYSHDERNLLKDFLNKNNLIL